MVIPVSDTALHVRWVDGRAEPQCKPNPAYPKGIDLDLSEGAARTCETALPYPAKRIGTYIITCKVCGRKVACTTAGRPDDPRFLKMPCAPMAAA
jgi:hypothetical protein